MAAVPRGGQLPVGDTHDAKPSGSDPRCLSLVKSAGLTPANHDDVGTVLFICAPFLLLDAVLARSGGRTRFGPDRRDGADAVRVFGWVPACECLRYTGPVARAPE